MSTSNTAQNQAKSKSSDKTLAANAKASVEETLEKANETLDQVSTRAQSEIRKAKEQTTDFVKENPGVAVAGAFGIGILVGLALRQRY